MHYGVKIGNYHTLTDWGLYLLRGWTISPAPENRYTVSIPGADGQHDLTKSLTGRVTYGNRTAKLTFKGDAPRDSWQAIYHDIVNSVNGETLEIIFDTEPEYYYTGFVSVGELVAIDNHSFKIKFTIDLEPFKWENKLTEVSLSLDGTVRTTFVEITSGVNVTPDAFNTDIRYGTQQIPTYDFSDFSELLLTWEKASESKTTDISLVDGNGLEVAYSVTYGTYELTIIMAELTDIGFDPSTIWRIKISNGINVLVNGKTTLTILEVESGERNSSMVISVPYGEAAVVFEGVKYSLNKGANSCPEIELKKGKNELLFSFSSVPESGEIYAAYRKGWL